jgi:endosialidase-like protein
MKTTTSIKEFDNRVPLYAFLLVPFVLACFALSPQARAVCQQGCITNDNTVLGEDALISNTTGNSNTATGKDALANNTIGSTNTATGSSALFSNTTGSGNTAVGYLALQVNTTGYLNTAIGGEALFQNSTGTDNTAVGYEALGLNTTGSSNTAIGLLALNRNTSADNNTATGFYALNSNTTGAANAATGSQALYKNITGNFNTATGYRALGRNTTGRTNIGLGFEAGLNLTTGSNNIDIGNGGVQAESNTIRIGTVGTQTATFIAGINGATVPTGLAVIVDAGGHLGTVTSSARFKETIKPMDKASEAILALEPVTFHYKHELDPAGIPQFGLVAEEVERVNPDLVARDAYGKAYSVRYEAVNAMLLNEFLKEHVKVEKLEATVARQQKDFQQQIQILTARLDAQEANLQKVNDQLVMSKGAPQLVAGK